MVCVLTTVRYIILSTEDLSLNQSKPTVQVCDDVLANDGSGIYEGHI
jgi:hypothetical protein